MAGLGSTMAISSSTITGEGASPYIAQNGVQISFGGRGTVKSSTITGNECDEEVCGPQGAQGAGVLFFEAAAGSELSKSTVSSNDMGAYYLVRFCDRSGLAGRDAQEGHVQRQPLRGGGARRRQGAAERRHDQRAWARGVALYQFEGALSASESSAKKLTVNGQSQAAIKVESDKQPGDIPGKFTVMNFTHTADGATLINESSNFEVLFS